MAISAYIREKIKNVEKTIAAYKPTSNKILTRTYTLWQNYELNLEDYIEEYKACHDIDDDEEVDEYEATLWAEACNDDNLVCEKENLKALNYITNKIIGVADLGFWNGRSSGYCVVDEFTDCLNIMRDTINAKFYVDEYGDLCTKQSHRDGNHYLTFRRLKDISDEELEELENALYEGEDVADLVEKYTTPLGIEIAVIYGWPTL